MSDMKIDELYLSKIKLALVLVQYSTENRKQPMDEVAYTQACAKIFASIKAKIKMGSNVKIRNGFNTIFN